MKLIKALHWGFMLILGVFLWPGCQNALAMPPEDEEMLDVYPVGDLEIIAVPDAHGTMESTLLPQLDKYPVLKTYFDNGPLPGINKVYYFQVGDRRVLVDTGWGTEQGKAGRSQELLAAQGIDPASITDILLTHLDHDHIGGLTRGGKAVYPNATIHVSVPEWNAWQEGKVVKRAPDKVKLAQDLGRIYAGKVKTFQFGDEVLPGVKAVDASGHTPGHTAYAISSGEDKFTIAGDIMHIAKVQLQRPELSTIYDMDMEGAAAARQRILTEMVRDGGQLAGMHMSMVSPVRPLEGGGFAMREPR